MTTISDIATETILRTEGFGWIPEPVEAPYDRATRPLPGVKTDELLRLDRPAWGWLFSIHNVDRQLDRLVVNWRMQSDYRELRKIASSAGNHPASRPSPKGGGPNIPGGTTIGGRSDIQTSREQVGDGPNENYRDTTTQ